MVRADPQVRDVAKEDGYTPLHRACWGQEQRHVDTVRVLITAGGVHPGLVLQTD